MSVNACSMELEAKQKWPCAGSSFCASPDSARPLEDFAHETKTAPNESIHPVSGLKQHNPEPRRIDAPAKVPGQCSQLAIDGVCTAPSPSAHEGGVTVGIVADEDEDPEVSALLRRSSDDALRNKRWPQFSPRTPQSDVQRQVLQREVEDLIETAFGQLAPTLVTTAVLKNVSDWLRVQRYTTPSSLRRAFGMTVSEAYLRLELAKLGAPDELTDALKAVLLHQVRLRE